MYESLHSRGFSVVVNTDITSLSRRFDNSDIFPQHRRRTDNKISITPKINMSLFYRREITSIIRN